MMRRIGFVGLGNIGEPASLNLLRAGFAVVAYSLRPSAVFSEAGGVQATSLAELASCDLVIQSLPSVSALTATVDGLLPHLRPGQIIADISSYSLDLKLREAERIERAGAVMLDCEISGLPSQVTDRTAVLFCAGDATAVSACGPVFDAFTAQHFYLGAFGSATKMKLIANFMVCAHNLIAAEALNLGRAAGLDPAKMIEVLKPSAAGSATFANKAPIMLTRQFAAGKGPFSHMFGYLERTRSLARDSGVAAAIPVLERISEIYGQAETEGRHSQDIAAIIEILEAMGSTGRHG
jgi:3-hydroxyisobutyrate dehydrogenase-like beta-hydroxyacid dehydrogenase